MTGTALRPDRPWQLALAILYLAFYAWMLVAGHGMPYVMDANESFSIYGTLIISFISISPTRWVLRTSPSARTPRHIPIFTPTKAISRGFSAF